MAVERSAEAIWEHDLLRGSGRVKGTSGAFSDLPVSWAARTEQSGGKTSPEELLAAAHSSCYSMALSAALGRDRHPPERLHVKATATFDKVGEAWKVTKMNLEVRGRVPGIDPAKFAELAQKAGETCPISGALKGNVAVSVTAQLE
jgi:lipoyl-dependent peroxiredoxin